MKVIKQIVYRFLTNAEFFNINKPFGTEKAGGGQAYIDFSLTNVSVAAWEEFFSGVPGIQQTSRAKGPSWQCPILSVGISSDDHPQPVTIYQRRASSVCIASQKLNSREGNRILAWHPTCGFPEPVDPSSRTQLPPGLAIYLAKTKGNEVWAGWFLRDPTHPDPARDLGALKTIEPLVSKGNVEGSAGILKLTSDDLGLDPTDSKSPFFSLGAGLPTLVKKSQAPTKAKNLPKKATAFSPATYKARSEAEILANLFQEDSEPENNAAAANQTIRTITIKKRNLKAVKDLKDLYGHSCQITGTRFLFKKIDGTYYTEAHHLVPLGTGGEDDPRNILVVSPLVHRMLHYANVSSIDLSKIQGHEDGTSFLDIQINGETFRIRWHKNHAESVLKNEEKKNIHLVK